MKAVIYARYSCDRQNEQSIEGQLHECYDYARKHDITIVKEYIDRALSGQSETKVELRYYDYTLLMCFMLSKKK